MLTYPIVVAIVTGIPVGIIVAGIVARAMSMDSSGHIPTLEEGEAPTHNVKAVYAHLDSLITGIDRAKKAGFHDFTVLSPLPRHEIEEVIYEGRPSPVRWWTLAGGICGGTGGFTLAALTSMVWPMTLPGGKPIVSVPPFVIITFESTVLIGGLITLAAIIYHCRLPAFDLDIECEDPRFSSDRFGLVLHGVKDDTRRKLAFEMLHNSGAEEVSSASASAEEAPTEEVTHGS